MKKNGKKDNYITSWIAPFWALAGTMCLPYMLNLKGETLAISNSWYSVLLWAFLWVSIKWALDRVLLFLMPCFWRVVGTGAVCSVWRWDDVAFRSSVGRDIRPFDRKIMGVSGEKG